MVDGAPIEPTAEQKRAYGALGRNREAMMFVAAEVWSHREMIVSKGDQSKDVKLFVSNTIDRVVEGTMPDVSDDRRLVVQVKDREELSEIGVLADNAGEYALYTAMDATDPRRGDAAFWGQSRTELLGERIGPPTLFRITERIVDGVAEIKVPRPSPASTTDRSRR